MLNKEVAIGRRMNGAEICILKSSSDRLGHIDLTSYLTTRSDHLTISPVRHIY